MSKYVTLVPGDVIWFGCDGPTIPDQQAGDLVEVVNDVIGVLANRVVRGRRIGHTGSFAALARPDTYSPLIPAARMMGHHFSISAL